MSLPTRIELCSGADSRLRQVLWLAWFTALINLFVYSVSIPSWILLMCVGALCWSLPLKIYKQLQQHQLILHASGQAQWGHEQGEWRRDTWRCRLYTVICFKSAESVIWLWISASNNSPVAYRQLGVWCRFSPQPTLKGVNDSH